MSKVCKTCPQIFSYQSHFSLSLQKLCCFVVSFSFLSHCFLSILIVNERISFDVFWCFADQPKVYSIVCCTLDQAITIAFILPQTGRSITAAILLVFFKRSLGAIWLRVDVLHLIYLTSKFRGVYDTFEKLTFPAYSVLLILWKFEETKVEPMHSLWQVSYIQWTTVQCELSRICML